MFKVGLTGGIGSGKTTVARMFEALGVPVYYYDDAAKVLYNTDRRLESLIKECFGQELYVDGELDRKRLANIVFSDIKKLDQLHILLKPFIEADKDSWLEANKDARYVILETAILFERNLERSVDRVVGVTAPESVRLERAMRRDNATEEQVRARMARQMDDDTKMGLCDDVIKNEAAAITEHRVKSLHQRLQYLSTSKFI